MARARFIHSEQREEYKLKQMVMMCFVKFLRKENSLIILRLCLWKKHDYIFSGYLKILLNIKYI